MRIAGPPDQRWPASRILLDYGKASNCLAGWYPGTQVKLDAFSGSPLTYCHMVGHTHSGLSRVGTPATRGFPNATGLSGGGTPFSTQLSRAARFSQTGLKLPPPWASPGTI